jgi:hypothetical protein
MTRSRTTAAQVNATHVPAWRWLTLSLFIGATVAMSSTVWAQGADIYQGADLKLGEQLIAQNQCTQCHATKVGGDGSAMYKPMGRINNAGLLRGMVEQCNSMLNFQMFPEEVTAVAAVLNRDHYKFK